MNLPFGPTDQGKSTTQVRYEFLGYVEVLRCSPDSVLQIARSRRINAAHYKPITPSFHAYGLNQDQQSKLLIVYRMGGLCGGAHEISGIKAPLFPCGGWLEGSWGRWVVVVWVIGWVGGDGVSGLGVVVWVPMTPPIMGGIRCPPCYFLTIR